MNRDAENGHDPAAANNSLTRERAAQLLFDKPRATVNFEAADEAQARRAVEEFAGLFENAPGVFKPQPRV